MLETGVNGCTRYLLRLRDALPRMGHDATADFLEPDA